MVGSSALAAGLRSERSDFRQDDVEAHTLPRVPSHRERAAEDAADQIVADVESKPAAAAAQAGGEEGIEDAVADAVGDALAVVAVAQPDALAIDLAGREPDRAAIDAVEAVQERVADQIGEYLLERAGIAVELQSGGNVELDALRATLELRPQAR